MAATIESASGLGTDTEARLGVALGLVGLAVLVSEGSITCGERGSLLTQLIQNRIALLNGEVTKNDKSRQFNGYAREGNPVVNDGRE